MKSLPILWILAVLLPFAAAQDPGQDITCSETKLCAEGCCGLEGICGMGPDFCGPGKCINSCDAKSECDPAGWGKQYAANEKCPLNVCCSRFGFCGATEEFCGADGFAASPRCSGSSATKKTIGYFEGWGVGRPCGAIFPEDLQVGAYTHLNFAFAMINPDSFEIAPMIESDKEMYRRLTALKRVNKGLQVWISIGGWSMNDPGPTFTTFSDLAGSDKNQQRFFRSLISFMNQYGFDGVDIDWEYPGAEERGGRPGDFANFPVLLRNLRKAFAEAGRSWGITVTFPASFWYLQHFDVKAIEQAVDWINVMTYDIHGTWDALNKWEGPLVKPHTDIREIDAGLKLLWRNNVDPSKVVLGIGFYGRSFKLADPSCKDVGCKFTGGGDPGQCTGSEGTLSYAEILQLVADGNTPTLNREAAVQILTYNGDNWVSYDDATTLKMKVDWANQNCLGGTMVWAASLDDKAGSAATALSGSTGLLDRFKVGIVIPDDGLGQCTWTGCSQACPPGTTMAGGYWPASPLGCPGPSGGKANQRRFCCPIGRVPECTLRGIDSSADQACNPSCEAGEVAVSSTYQWLGLSGENLCPAGGYISMCCKASQSTSVFEQCTWTECGGSCPSNRPRQMLQTLRGDAGMNVCTSGLRSLCCENPPPVEKCQWYRNAFHNVCTPGCPAGKIELAIDNQGPNCASGFGSYCCDISPAGRLGRRDDLYEWSNLVDSFVKRGVCDAPTPTFPIRRRGFETVIEPRAPKGLGIVLASVIAAELWPMLRTDIGINPLYQDQLVIWDDTMRNLPSPYRYWTSDNLRVAAGGGAPDGDGGDPVGALRDAFCCEACAPNLAVSAGSATEVCELIPGGSDGLVPRTFEVNQWEAEGPLGPNVRLPTVGRLFHAIANGDARMEFARYFRYGQGTAASTELELEIVFLLGRDRAHMNTALMQVADGPNATPFAVIHIHFSGGPRARVGENGLGITSINVAHATHISRRNGAALRYQNNEPVDDGAWEVQGRREPRDVFNCHRGLNDAANRGQRHYQHNNARQRGLMQAAAEREVLYRQLNDFMDFINRRGLLRNRNAAMLARDRNGIALTPPRYVTNQDGQWQNLPGVDQAGLRSALSVDVDNVVTPYNPARQNNGDLWERNTGYARRNP